MRNRIRRQRQTPSPTAPTQTLEPARPTPDGTPVYPLCMAGTALKRIAACLAPCFHAVTPLPEQTSAPRPPAACAELPRPPGSICALSAARRCLTRRPTVSASACSRPGTRRPQHRAGSRAAQLGLALRLWVRLCPFASACTMVCAADSVCVESPTDARSGRGEGTEASGADPRREKQLLQSAANFKGHLGQPGSFASGGLPARHRAEDAAPQSAASPEAAAQPPARVQATPEGSNETMRELLQSHNILLRDYRAGQHRGTCPKCQGGSTSEKSLSVIISEDGRHTSARCFRATCNWSVKSGLGEHANTQLRAGAAPPAGCRQAGLCCTARLRCRARQCVPRARLGARQGARQACGAACKADGQTGAPVAGAAELLRTAGHQPGRRGAEPGAAGAPLVAQARAIRRHDRCARAAPPAASQLAAVHAALCARQAVTARWRGRLQRSRTSATASW